MEILFMEVVYYFVAEYICFKRKVLPKMKTYHVSIQQEALCFTTRSKMISIKQKKHFSWSWCISLQQNTFSSKRKCFPRLKKCYVTMKQKMLCFTARREVVPIKQGKFFSSSWCIPLLQNTFAWKGKCFPR